MACRGTRSGVVGSACATRKVAKNAIEKERGTMMLGIARGRRIHHDAQGVLNYLEKLLTLYIPPCFKKAWIDKTIRGISEQVM